eukprot:1161252-Pelagomonas_calceolata.AAC.8
MQLTDKIRKFGIHDWLVLLRQNILWRSRQKMHFTNAMGPSDGFRNRLVKQPVLCINQSRSMALEATCSNLLAVIAG